MFDFLEVFKPVTEYCIDNFGMAGVFLSTAAPVVALALAAGLLYLLFMLVTGTCFGKGAMGAKLQLQKAGRLRKAGKYEAAYDLYVKIHEKQRKDHLVTSYDIGLLCKEGEAKGWKLHDPANSSLHWFRKSLNPLKPETHYEYGLCLIDSKNLKEAAEGATHMKLAASLGCSKAKPVVGHLEQRAGLALVAGDYNAAAGFGDAESQYKLARKASGAEAVCWLELAAKQNHLQASEALGIRYARGEDVQENLSKAVMLLTRPAEQGSMNAQAYLGLLYDNKKYPRHDEEEAISWYKKAAEQGHPYAMFNLAVIYARKMDEYATAHNLTTRLDRISDKTYRGYYEHFTYWKDKAAAKGVTAESVAK